MGTTTTVEIVERVEEGADAESGRLIMRKVVNDLPPLMFHVKDCESFAAFNIDLKAVNDSPPLVFHDEDDEWFTVFYMNLKTMNRSPPLNHLTIFLKKIG